MYDHITRARVHVNDIRSVNSRVPAVVDRYGCVDMCINHGECKDAVLILKDLCKKLDGVHDWTGVFVHPGFP